MPLGGTTNIAFDKHVENTTLELWTDLHVTLGTGLGDDFVHKPDPMWRFEPSSREWQTLQALLLNAAQIHIIGELEAKEQIAEARKLLDSIDSWLSQN